MQSTIKAEYSIPVSPAAGHRLKARPLDPSDGRLLQADHRYATAAAIGDQFYLEAVALQNFEDLGIQ